jgi:ABC-type amino acid transport/signal transduction systems, periplasmic component/domain
MNATKILLSATIGLAAVAFAAAQTAANPRTIRVGTGNAMKPYCFIDESNKLTGYDVEVLRKIDDYLPEYKFKIDSSEFSAILVGVETGKIDLASHEFAKNPEREKKFIFPDRPFGHTLLKLVVKQDRSDINKFEDLVGKTIYQGPTSNFYKVVKDWNDKNPAKKINLVAIDNQTSADAFQMVADGRQDATTSFPVIFDQIQKQLQLPVKVTGTVWKGDVFFILPKTETQLKARIDEALAALEKDGTLSALSVKWLGEDVFKD